MKNHNMMSLLGGAIMGAAAMYLLYPEMGERRRKYVAKQAGEYMGEAGDALQSGWDKVSDYASDFGSTISDRAQDYGGRLSDLAADVAGNLKDRAGDTASSWRDRADDARSDMGDRAQGWLDRGRKLLHRYGNQAHDYRSGIGDTVQDYSKSLWKQVRGLGSDVGDRARSATKSARSYIGEDSTPVVPVALTAVGACALGAGIMYMTDPKLGRSRRAWLIDKSRSFMNRTGKSFYRTGKHMANRAKGMAYEAKGAGEDLVSRVRTALQSVVPNAQGLDVSADREGTVTLGGQMSAEDSRRAVSACEQLPGVRLVVSRFRVTDVSDAVSPTTHATGGYSQM